MRAVPKILGVALVAGVLLAGCTDGDSSSSNGAMSPQSAQDAAGQAPAPEQGTDGAAKAPDLSVDQRSIIYTGSLTVRVKNVDTAAAQATGIAGAAGGFIGKDDRHSGDGTGDASLELRVPAAKFAAVVDQLAALGTEERRGLSTEDVTEQTVDLDARITVQQARVDSGRRLLGRAKSLEDLVMLEREVATRESDLASLQAKKRRLADLTALSTITVVLLDPDAEATGDDDGSPGFLAGLSGGWDALRASLGVLLTVLGAVLPWLLALGLPIWAMLWALRRYRRRRAARAGVPALATPAPPGPAPRPSPRGPAGP